ncbi:PAS domain S-box-containing protein [Haloferula luteola]|uniref:PAS domain S-box-containing protein n=1 Tax=Haloferula luteola TaxID=595692 RepID=A0A840UZS0_9BACT|nr:AraC family transcriptional regulator [Haloferula luteola]MBB5350326.1 PAS domain S-box-containing protein [Haloferula luteola]
MKPESSIPQEFQEVAGGLIPVDRLFDGVPDIVFFVKDARGRYVSVNDTLVERCGLKSRHDLIGRTVEHVFPPPLAGEFAGQDVEVLKTGTPIRDRLELHLYPGGSSGWCLTYKEPVRGRDGRIVGLCGISRDLHAPYRQDDEFGALSTAVDHIHRHFDEPLRLPMLAEMAGLSVYQFDQRIRSLFHVTAGQYLVKVRLDAACERLSTTKEPIAQVALSCGYSDQSAFSRQFKQAVGISPLEYRKRFAAAE